MSLPSITLRLPAGDEAVIALHGAQVLSWLTADGTERLYLSPKAVFDGQAAIRGGVPVCFPQFNDRGPLPKHGFARNLAWQPCGQTATAREARASLQLRDSEATRQFWPAAFLATLEAILSPGALRIELQIHNTGAEPFSFTAALHTYLRVEDVAEARLQGLAGAAYRDAVSGERRIQAEGAPAFGGELDRVYQAPMAQGAGLRLGALAICQSESLADTVVWNPGPVRGAAIGDLPADGWRHLLCVEAAHVEQPVPLAAGAHWHGWQSLAMLAG